mgnify:CR=1 FL=1
MSNKLSRRQVLASSALTLAGAIVRAAPPGPGRGLLSIKQLLKFGMFQDDALTIEDKFEILKEIGFDGPCRPDHVPTLSIEENDNPGYTTLGRLFAIGYMKGLIDGTS